MRLDCSILFLLSLCACEPRSAPWPGKDAGPDEGVIVLPQGMGLIRGGSAFGLVTANGTEPVTGLIAEVPEFLTATFDSDTITPGKAVLLRLDARADAPEWTMATLRLSGTQAGVWVRSETQVYMSVDSKARLLFALVNPPVLDVSGGVPATAQLILAPMSTATKGTLVLRPIRFVQFEREIVEIDGPQPVILNLTVTADARTQPGTRIQVEGFLGRTRAVDAPFELVAKPPDLPANPPTPLGYDLPENVYLRPGGTVSIDLTRFGQAAQQATQWTFADVPEGVTATASKGVLMFVAATSAPGGAHLVRLQGSRDGFTEEDLLRLFVGRSEGDWPLLGDSPTVPDAKGVLNPGSTSMAVDAAGTVYVVCPDAARRSLMSFKGCAWSEGMPLGACGTIDNFGSKPCYVGPIDESAAAGLLGSCWAPPQAMTLVSIGFAARNGWEAKGGVVMGHDLNGTPVFVKWGTNSWDRVGQPLLPIAGKLLDLAAHSRGVVVAAQEVVDLSTTELQVSVFDGQVVKKLGDVGADLSYPPHDPNARLLDVLAPAAMEVAPDGNPVVAWIGADDNAIHVSKWDGAAWLPLAQPLPASPGFFIDAVKLKLDPAGVPIVAWLEAGFPRTQWSQYSNTDWSPYSMEKAPVRIHVSRVGAVGWEALSSPVNLDPNGPASDVSLSLDASGRPHVAWKEADRVFVARYAR